MSDKCEKCGEHALECICGSLCRRQQNGQQIDEGQHPPAERISVKLVNVRGRREHEALLRDAKKCSELGLDQVYETIVYLKRWGSWLGQ